MARDHQCSGCLDAFSRHSSPARLQGFECSKRQVAARASHLPVHQPHVGVAAQLADRDVAEGSASQSEADNHPEQRRGCRSREYAAA